MQCITHWSCLGPLNDVSHLLMFEVPARGWGADVNRPLAILVSNILRRKKNSLLWRVKFSPSCFWISSWQNCCLKMVSPVTRVYPPFKTTFPMFPPGKKNTWLKTKPLSRSLLFDFQDDLKRVVVLYCFKRRTRDLKTSLYFHNPAPKTHTHNCMTAHIHFQNQWPCCLLPDQWHLPAPAAQPHQESPSWLRCAAASAARCWSGWASSRHPATAPPRLLTHTCTCQQQM